MSARSTNEQLRSITYNAHTRSQTQWIWDYFFLPDVKSVSVCSSCRFFRHVKHFQSLSFSLPLTFYPTHNSILFSLFDAWNHEYRLFNVYAFYIASETVFFIKYSFFSYIFVFIKWAPLMIIFGFSVVCASPCFISFKFIQSLTTHSNSNFQRGHQMPYSVIHIHIPLWLVIEYFITCIGYSEKACSERERERENIEKNQFYALDFMCILSWRIIAATKRNENPTREKKEIGQELTDLVDVKETLNMKYHFIRYTHRTGNGCDRYFHTDDFATKDCCFLLHSCTHCAWAATWSHSIETGQSFWLLHRKSLHNFYAPIKLFPFSSQNELLDNFELISPFTSFETLSAVQWRQC